MIAGCHCRVPLQCAMVGEGRALGEWTWCHCRVPISVSYVPPIFWATKFTQAPKKTTMNLASCKRYTVLYIDNTKIVFCYLGSMLV